MRLRPQGRLDGARRARHAGHVAAGTRQPQRGRGQRQVERRPAIRADRRRQALRGCDLGGGLLVQAVGEERRGDDDGRAPRRRPAPRTETRRRARGRRRGGRRGSARGGGRRAGAPRGSSRPRTARGGSPRRGRRAARTTGRRPGAARRRGPGRRAGAPAAADRRTAGGSGTTNARRRPPRRTRWPLRARAGSGAIPRSPSAHRRAARSRARGPRCAGGGRAPRAAGGPAPPRAGTPPPCARCRRTRRRSGPARDDPRARSSPAAARPPIPRCARAGRAARSSDSSIPLAASSSRVSWSEKRRSAARSSVSAPASRRRCSPSPGLCRVSSTTRSCAGRCARNCSSDASASRDFSSCRSSITSTPRSAIAASASVTDPQNRSASCSSRATAAHAARSRGSGLREPGAQQHRLPAPGGRGHDRHGRRLRQPREQLPPRDQRLGGVVPVAVDVPGRPLRRGAAERRPRRRRAPARQDRLWSRLGLRGRSSAFRLQWWTR